MTETIYRKCLIVCNGVFPSEKRLRKAVRETDLIVCADGGADKLLCLGVRPDYIVGDQDSTSKEALASLEAERVVLAWDQSFTDFDKTVRFVLDRGIRDIVVVGATGGRVDHTVGNLGVLRKYHRQAHIILIDDDCWIAVPDGSLTFTGPVGQKVSLIPFGRADEITTQGLKWPLSGEFLELGVRDGTSNEVASNPVAITVGRGDVAVCVFHCNE